MKAIVREIVAVLEVEVLEDVEEKVLLGMTYNSTSCIKLLGEKKKKSFKVSRRDGEGRAMRGNKVASSSEERGEVSESASVGADVGVGVSVGVERMRSCGTGRGYLTNHHLTTGRY